MLLDVVAGAEPQQLLLLKPSVRQILHILQTGSWVREGNVIDRDTDAYCVKTVHLLNQVDEADLLHLMDEEEAAKPDPDADYVDDDEDFGYVEEDDEDLDFTADSEDTEPV